MAQWATWHVHLQKRTTQCIFILLTVKQIKNKFKSFCIIWRTVQLENDATDLYHECFYQNRSLPSDRVIISKMYTMSPKNCAILFCQNFLKFPPILIIFSRMTAKRLKLYEVHSFSTSSNWHHHTTTLNADVPDCYTMMKVVSIRLLTFALSVRLWMPRDLSMLAALNILWNFVVVIVVYGTNFELSSKCFFFSLTSWCGYQPVALSSKHFCLCTCGIILA